MKINILFKFKNKGWGGGNQFLKFLKKKLLENNIYEGNPLNADIIITNSHHWIDFILKIIHFKNKTIIHRIDGPISKIRINSKNSFFTDRIIYLFNYYFADGTIFQSNWSKINNINNGLIIKDKSAVIINECDNDIFREKDKKDINKKLSIVISSWSSNINKGFDTYNYIDQNANFNKYNITFIGNTPINFKNIKILPPLDPLNLSKELSKFDIYITASVNDPCSNSLIEAISVGLMPIVINSGGHPEIIKNNGYIFNNKLELLSLLNELTHENLINKKNQNYKNDMNSINKYIEFIYQTHKYKKNINIFSYIRYYSYLLLNVIFYKFFSILRKS